MRLRILACLLVMLFGTAPSLAGKTTEPHQSKISSVTVFPKLAQVTRTIDIALEAGDHTIVLDHLPLKLLRNSVKVIGKADGKLTINSVDVRKISPATTDKPVFKMSEPDRAQLDTLQAQKRMRTEEKTYLALQVTSIKRRRELLMIMPPRFLKRPLLADLPKSDGQKSKIVIEVPMLDWPRFLGMIEQADTNLDAKQHKINMRKNQLDLEIVKLDHEISETTKKIKKKQAAFTKVAQEAADKTRMSIKVFLSAKLAVRGKLHVQYLINGAGWQPLYDARLSTGTTKIQPALLITRNALVKQNTGEDWNNIKLKLSTTRTDQRNAAPRLNQLEVSYQRPGNQNYQPKKIKQSMQDRRVPKSAPRQQLTRTITHAPVKLDRGNYHAQFTLPGKLDIASDGEDKKVTIGIINIKPKLADLVVPEKDNTAYLYAKFNHNKGNAALLPGPVALYRDGMFVGNSALPLVSAGQEHLLGFGPDDAIKVRRETVARKKQKTGFLIQANMEERHYRIIVHNLHQRAIKITVLDRIPHSFIDEITVLTLPDASKPDRLDVGNQKGVLAWDLELAPDAKQTIEHTYRIDWPANRDINYYDRVLAQKTVKQQHRRSKMRKLGLGARIKF